MAQSDRLDLFVNLMKSVADMKEMCDVNLISGEDNQKFPVHRLIMRASSEYFHILLGPNFREGTEENVVLKEIDGETLKSIIHFVYHREITIDHGNFINILRASSWMGLTDLQNRCASFGIGVNAENCIEILLIADGFDKLKSIAFDVICENFEKLPYDEIEEIDEANYEKLLMCDQLSGAETDIFNGLVHWISINKAEGDICISKLLKQIRLKNIPKAVLMDSVEQFFVKHNQRDLISDEYYYRLSHPKNAFMDRRRPKDIYLASILEDKLIIRKYYDQEVKRWMQFITIALESNFDGGMVDANGQLYLMGGRAADKMCAYDLRDFSRSELPNMITKRTGFTSVAVGNYIYVFGGVQVGLIGDSLSCERYDIEKKMWITRNNMPMGSQYMTAIEYNGLIHVGFTNKRSSRWHTQLFCYDPANDTWQLKVEVADRAVFAKKLSSLYVIEGVRFVVVHRYNSTDGVLSEVGKFSLNGRIDQAIGLGDNLYLLGGNQFMRLKLRKDVTKINLTSIPRSNQKFCYVD